MRARKSLGQNFLNSAAMLAKMAAAAELKVGELALEIGPGRGSLTDTLLATGARVVAVEKDGRLIGFLKQKFASQIKSGQLTLVHDDILKFDPTLRRGYKLISNIPYYLTGQLLRQFLTSDRQPSVMALMLQKEVAERIVAKDKKESRLSISVKAYGEPHYIQTVPAELFSPAPKVDSAIMLIDRINKNNFQNGVSEEKFFTLLKRGFAGKRKMLKNNLALRADVLGACGIAPTARAENLSVEQWLDLAKL